MSASELESTIAQVQGVYSARVILDQTCQPQEIHIIASTERPPKRLVRDVETLVFVKHGIRVDYRKVSLVQLKEEDLLRLPLARPEIRQVVEDDLGNHKRIRVEIRRGSKTVYGEATEKVDHPMVFHTAARATIACIEQLVGQSMDVRLEDATSFRMDSREIALVILTCLAQDREETFVGASFVGEHPAAAAARATLDAINRRLLTPVSLR